MARRTVETDGSTLDALADPLVDIHTDDLTAGEGEDLLEEIIPDAPAETKPRPAATHHARVPLDTYIAPAWLGAGTALMRFGIAPTGGRVMRLQSPLAGTTLDAVIEGSVLDRFLQPLARMGGALETLSALVTAPVLAEILARKPELMPVLLPRLMGVVVDSLAAMGPQLLQDKAETEKKIRDFAAVSEAFGLDADIDPTEALFAYIFAPEPEVPNAE